ncbi:aromatic prenyltransferase [Streptomyces hokutonensis]|uniref:aromatic prenyltransferase n=1 Tax=Streptomyces hokutonensis TaxID=1306990 RepID=UPI00381E62C2
MTVARCAGFIAADDARARPLDDVLGVAGMPSLVRERGPALHRMGLDHVRHVACARCTALAGYTFAVTISPATGWVERTAFYALKLSEGQFPTIGGRLATFFETAPSCDIEDMNAVAWSFGSRSGTYIKAERSYCGDLISLIKGWNTFFSQSNTTDPALPARGDRR